LNVPAEILRFEGPVKWEAGPGPAGLTLLGRIVEPDGQTTAAQLSLICREAPDLPANLLQDLTVETPSAGEVLLRSGAREWRVHCNTWQLHRDVGETFYAAIPPRRMPWTRRLSWRLLLGVAATSPGRWLLSRRSRAK
jgi:hypothetical protein